MTNTNSIGILVARAILAGDVSLARQYAAGHTAWPVSAARAIASACREANRRWGCALDFAQFCV